jgi:hypothetical protein
VSPHPGQPNAWAQPCRDSYGRQRRLVVLLVDSTVQIIVPGTPPRLDVDGLDELITDLRNIRHRIRGTS